MSDPQGQLSGLPVDEAPLNRSSSTADFLPDISQYFAVWLENLKPSLEPNKNHSQPETAVDAPTADAFVSGEFRFEGTLRVDGYAAGFLRSWTGTLIVGESAEVECEINVATVIVDGFLRGDIHASESVELGSRARVFGSIESPALSIQPGAVFEGQCHFLPSPYQADGKDNGGTRPGAHTFSRPVSSDSPDATEEAGEEEAEPLAFAASR
jgi:cytoskeletal protein CcmA (bactofilin family)